MTHDRPSLAGKLGTNAAVRLKRPDPTEASNGEYLHWDTSHASNIAARTALPQFEANLRYRYHEAVAPIAYFFICFAHFVDDSMKRSMAKSAA